jgi:hypothetical protein
LSALVFSIDMAPLKAYYIFPYGGSAGVGSSVFRFRKIPE